MSKDRRFKKGHYESKILPPHFAISHVIGFYSPRIKLKAYGKYKSIAKVIMSE